LFPCALSLSLSLSLSASQKAQGAKGEETSGSDDDVEVLKRKKTFMKKSVSRGHIQEPKLKAAERKKETKKKTRPSTGRKKETKKATKRTTKVTKRKRSASKAPPKKKTKRRRKSTKYPTELAILEKLSVEELLTKSKADLFVLLKDSTADKASLSAWLRDVFLKRLGLTFSLGGNSMVVRKTKPE
jgi:hypothetical protein